MIRFNSSIWLTKRLFGSSAVSGKDRNHYEVLGLGNHATIREIKSAYFELSKVHHPDKAGGDSERFRLISNAYQVLSDANARKLYDYCKYWGLCGQAGEIFKKFTRFSIAIAETIRRTRPQSKSSPSASTFGSEGFRSRTKSTQTAYGTTGASGTSDRGAGNSGAANRAHRNFTDANYQAFYNQNEWTRAHYSYMFREQQFTSRLNYEKNKNRREVSDSFNPTIMIFAIIVIGWFFHYSTMMERIRDQEWNRERYLIKRKD